jgi:hypothetical protein
MFLIIMLRFVLEIYQKYVFFQKIKKNCNNVFLNKRLVTIVSNFLKYFYSLY